MYIYDVLYVCDILYYTIYIYIYAIYDIRSRCVYVTCMSQVPGDVSALAPGGIRMGTPALTTRYTSMICTYICGGYAFISICF